MIIRKLRAERVETVKARNGMTIKCINGIVWMTAAGKDIILKSGQEIKWGLKSEKVVVYPVKNDATIAVNQSASFLKELSLFNQ